MCISKVPTSEGVSVTQEKYSEYDAGDNERHHAPLHRLVERIFEDNDRTALHELLDRPLCIWEFKKRIKILDFVYALHTNFARGSNHLLAENAYSKTVDKFTNIPEVSRDCEPSKKGDGRSAEYSRIDCRNYYSAWLKLFLKKVDMQTTALQQEVLAAATMQKFVAKHFFLSVAEARRSANPHVHRYLYPVNGRSISLYLPKSMSGSEKRAWLENEIKEFSLDDLHERERLQALIDMKLNRGAGERFHETLEAGRLSADVTLAICQVEQEFLMQGVAETVAKEKVEIIGQLKPSVRALGKDKLKDMILAVFEGHESGELAEGALARRFGMSAPSFSRFCGSAWAKGKAKPCLEKIPVLWKNLAQLFARHEQFIKVAKRTGVWKRVQEINAVFDNDHEEQEPHE